MTGKIPAGVLAGQRVCCLLISATPAYNARLIKVAEAAAGAGAAVTVVYSSPPDAVAPVGPFEVRWVDLGYAASKNPVWLIRVILNIWRQAVLGPLRLAHAAWSVDADIYHANFLTTLLPAYLAARLRRTALIYDVRDLLLDSHGALWPRWKKWYYSAIERHLTYRADAVLAVSKPMAEVLEQRHRINGVHVILNGPYGCASAPTPLVSPVRLFFQGAFSLDRNLLSLVRAMGPLRGKATLTLQGWGGVEQQLRDTIAELDLGDTVFFRDRCEPREVVACARDYDVGVIVHKADNLNHMIATPNKLFDYIGAGLAVAASDLPGHRSILEPTGCGVLLDPSTDESLAAGLSALVADPVAISRMKQASVDACRDLSWVSQAGKLVELYGRLLDR